MNSSANHPSSLSSKITPTRQTGAPLPKENLLNPRTLLFENFNYYAHFPGLSMKDMIFGPLPKTAACWTGNSWTQGPFVHYSP